jgi:4-amino-4-deoxy-L-arabinose transferase-like glycosyltransferase
VSFWKSQHRKLFLLIALAVLVRGGLLVLLHERLTTDIDAYLGIAKQIVIGEGFSVPGSEKPTAYRPPLYPLLLALIQTEPVGIIVLHLALGLGTVLLVWRLARRLIAESAALWCAGLIAFDPLLLQYTTLPMTETLCTFLAALTLNLMVPWPASKAHQLGLGLVLGLCILSRPTFLAFGVLALVGWSYRAWRSAEPIQSAGLVLAGLAVGVLPWGIRNALVFGEFRITTTHGGYTLLLANNPVFYAEVVDAPWGTVWKGDSLKQWQLALEADIKNTAPEVDTEFERDRWMTRRALSHIADHPMSFIKACAHRFLWFWNVFPPDSALDGVENLWKETCNRLGLTRLESWANGIARSVSGGVVLFYVLLFGSFAVGSFRLKRAEWSLWWPMALLVASFSAVHLVYWTDARMRAPVIPAVVLLAARAGFRPATKNVEHTTVTETP